MSKKSGEGIFFQVKFILEWVEVDMEERKIMTLELERYFWSGTLLYTLSVAVQTFQIGAVISVSTAKTEMNS